MIFRLIASAGAALFYLSFTGSSPSALRALLFLLLLHFAAVTGRRRELLALLSWCAVLIISFSIDPQPDLALVMSVLAVTGIVAASRGGVNLLARAAGAVLGAAMFTMPVAVWCSNGISLVGPVSNLLLSVPFGLFLIPWAVLLDILALLPGAVLKWMVHSWESAAALTVEVARLSTKFPASFLSLSMAGKVTASICAAMAIWLWGKGMFGLRRGVILFLLVACFSGAVHQTGQYLSSKELIVLFPSLGQADGAVLRWGRKTVLIDCGPPGLPGSAAPMVRTLQRHGIDRIDAIFVSHPHPDHAGGLDEIVNLWPVERIYMAGDHQNLNEWSKLLQNIPVNTPVRFLLAGDKIQFSGMKFTALNPESGNLLSSDANGGSMVLLIEGKMFSGLFTADAPWNLVAGLLTELSDKGRLAGKGGLDLLKIPHHGSATGFSGSGIEAAIAAMENPGETSFLCPSPPLGKGKLPSAKVVKWFVSKGIHFIYPEYPGITLRYSDKRNIEFPQPHFEYLDLLLIP